MKSPRIYTGTRVLELVHTLTGISSKQQGGQICGWHLNTYSGRNLSEGAKRPPEVTSGSQTQLLAWPEVASGGFCGPFRVGHLPRVTLAPKSSHKRLECLPPPKKKIQRGNKHVGEAQTVTGNQIHGYGSEGETLVQWGSHVLKWWVCWLFFSYCLLSKFEGEICGIIYFFLFSFWYHASNCFPPQFSHLSFANPSSPNESVLHPSSAFFPKR